jgi:hypothetical protein
MNPLAQIRLNQFDEESRKSLMLELMLFAKNKGEYCKKCDITQGEYYKGFPEYYCNHLSRKIKGKLKKQNKKILTFLNESITLMLQSNMQAEA